MKRIPIFFTFDDYYVPQAAVAFESLLAHAKEGLLYVLFVVHTSVSLDSQKKLLEQVAKHQNGQLEFIDISGRFQIDFSDEKYSKSHAGAVFTVDTLYRCLPSLIKEFDQYEKIIYSDVDIVVVDDISELYDFELEDNYLAGIRSPEFLSHQIDHLDDRFQGKYFGGGLWVMNLKAMREENLGERIQAIIKNPPCKMLWLDQDVMNLACEFKVKYFSYRYVSIPDWLKLLGERDFKDEYYPNGELYEAMYEPKIIHYAGTKPWGKNKPEKSDLWYYWLGKTPFAEKFQREKEEYYQKKSRPSYKVSFLGIPLGTICGEERKMKLVRLGLPLIRLRVKE